VSDEVAPELTPAQQKLKDAVDAIPFWYHRIKLPGGIVTPGNQPVAPNIYRIPMDLSGLRILDVGAWDGYWTFEALKRGAREVVAIDDFSDITNFRPGDGWQTFDLCRDALGYGNDRCKRINMSAYEVTEERLGRFDMVFFLGTLYHCRYPLFALDHLSSVCGGDIYVESAICDDFSPYHGGLGCGYPKQQPVMEFYPTDQYAQNPTNWWVPTLQLVGTMLLSAGWKRAFMWKLTDAPDCIQACRGFAKGEKSEEKKGLEKGGNI